MGSPANSGFIIFAAIVIGIPGAEKIALSIPRLAPAVKRHAHGASLRALNEEGRQVYSRIISMRTLRMATGSVARPNSSDGRALIARTTSRPVLTLPNAVN